MIIKNLRKFNLLSKYSFSTQDNHFGFKNVKTQQKQKLVDQVFHSVASNYDVMNDAMSFGIHRCWKNYFVQSLGRITSDDIYTNNQTKSQNKIKRVLDVAGGTGDIAFRILENHKSKNLKVTVLDINQSMLDEGKKKAQKLGISNQRIQFVCANAQQLPFQSNTFDAYTIAFGLRNVPRTGKAVNEATRVLKTGGRFMCLEFSKVNTFPLREIYKFYSFNIIPLMGEIIAKDKQSYQYLVQSIEKFYDQQSLLNILEKQGLSYCRYENLLMGIVALHSGFKINNNNNK